MGYHGYSDEELRRVVARWAQETPTPGSVGDKAKRDALAEWERRFTPGQQDNADHGSAHSG